MFVAKKKTAKQAKRQNKTQFKHSDMLFQWEWILSTRLQCLFLHLLGLHALMVWFEKSQKVPETAEQNLRKEVIMRY